jgi:hypothetical protein
VGCAGCAIHEIDTMPSTEIEKKMFGYLQEESTLQSYSMSQTRLLAFALRATLLRREKAASGEMVGFYNVRFTKRQRDGIEGLIWALERLEDKLEEVGEPNKGNGGDGEDEDDDDDDDEVLDMMWNSRDDGLNAVVESAVNSVHELSMSILLQGNVDDEATVDFILSRFNILDQMENNGGFTPAKNSSTRMARTMYCQRMVMAKHVLEEMIKGKPALT